MAYLFPPRQPPCLTIVGSDVLFPVRKIFCIGLNYAEHTHEVGMVSDRGRPLFFQKSPEALVPQQNAEEVLTITYPPATKDYHYEAELVVVLHKGGRNLTPDQADECIFGYAIGLDMTRRDLQNLYREKSWPWDMAKNFDESAPVGVLYPRSILGNLGNAEVTLDVNGTRQQTGCLDQMVWSSSEMVSEISKLVKVSPGDIIFTGTPSGIGPVQRGDLMEVSIGKLGKMRVSIK